MNRAAESSVAASRRSAASRESEVRTPSPGERQPSRSGPAARAAAPSSRGERTVQLPRDEPAGPQVRRPHRDHGPAASLQIELPGRVRLLAAVMGGISVVLDGDPERGPGQVQSQITGAWRKGRAPTSSPPGCGRPTSTMAAQQEPALGRRLGPPVASSSTDAHATCRGLSGRCAIRRATRRTPVRPLDRGHSGRAPRRRGQGVGGGANRHSRSVSTRLEIEHAQPCDYLDVGLEPDGRCERTSPGRGRRQCSYGTTTWTGIAAYATASVERWPPSYRRSTARGRRPGHAAVGEAW